MTKLHIYYNPNRIALIMKTKRLLHFITCMAIAGLSVQAAVVKGIIKDADGSPLPGASVQLVSLPDSTRVGYQMTGANGDFNFKDLKPGKYRFLAELSGMENIDKDIDIKTPDQTFDFGNLVLTESAVTLKEAVVTGVRAAVVAKQDTIEFNADSYHTAPNGTVNDLLKKLPGVEVGTDGSITSNGKTIKKILIDGKEFFGDDPQMASKNLPSNMVNKIQVVDRKSDLARLTGIDDGEEETVINLTVKKDMNNGWFGNVGAGYGTDKRYQGSFVINNFNNGNQITLLGGANNINEMGFSDMGRGSFRDFGGNGGINKSQRLGLNFNVGKEEIFRIGGNVLYSHTDRLSTRRTATQYLYPDYVNYQNAESRNRDRGHNISSDFRIQWNIDPQNTIEFRPRFRINFRDAESQSYSVLRDKEVDGEKINSNLNNQTNKGHSINTGGDFIFNHKVASHPGRSFSFRANYEFSDTRQKATTWSDIEYYLRQEDSEQLYRFLDNRSWSNSIESRITWTEPIGDVKRGNFLNFAYRLRYQWNNADKLTYNLPLPEDTENFVPQEFSQVPPGAELSEILSNSFRNKFFTQELQAGYKKVTKTYNLDAGLLFSPSSSKSEDLIMSERNIPERWVWNVSPYARFRYRFNQQSSLRVNYRARTSQPSMTQLQPVADVSDPLNIIVGNPDLKPTFTQSINLHFNNYKMETQQSIFVMFNGSYALNTIVSRTVTNPETGGRTTSYSNCNGNLNLFGMMMMTRSFTNRKWRFNARLNGRYGSTPGYINGDFNRTDNLSLSPSGGLTFSCDVFQMSVNPTYSFSQAKNSLPRQADRTTHAYGFNSDLSLYLPFGLQFNTDLAFSNTSGYAQGFDSKQWLWNAELSYSVLSDQSLTFSVRAYDLLGQKKNISRSIGANTIVDSEFNDLTRYIMFGVTWNFNTLKKKGKGPNGETDMWMPGNGRPVGPPPGGGRPMGPPPGGGRRPF